MGYPLTTLIGLVLVILVLIAIGLSSISWLTVKVGMVGFALAGVVVGFLSVGPQVNSVLGLLATKFEVGERWLALHHLAILRLESKL